MSCSLAPGTPKTATILLPGRVQELIGFARRQPLRGRPTASPPRPLACVSALMPDARWGIARAIMKQIATWLLTVFWLAAVFSEVPFLENAAQADELSPRQNEIIRTTMAADGWLTEDMHKEFWAQVPPSVRSNSETIKFLTQVIGEGINFHRETWESVMMSLQAGRVIKSPGYEAAKADILASPTAELLREQNAAGINSAERLISAAANKVARLVTPKGTLYITDELVAQTIAGLDASICRMKQLVNPSWAPKIEETRYADVYVRIFPDRPFQERISRYSR